MDPISDFVCLVLKLYPISNFVLLNLKLDPISDVFCLISDSSTSGRSENWRKEGETKFKYHDRDDHDWIHENDDNDDHDDSDDNDDDHNANDYDHHTDDDHHHDADIVTKCWWSSH